MSEKIELITTTRQDLVDISEALALALERPLLLNPKTPVVFAVNGSTESGKKIVADTALDILLPKEKGRTFEGKKGDDERWMGVVEGNTVEIGYIDIAWGHLAACRANYSDPSLRCHRFPTKIEAAFNDKRQHGGAAFIQNRSFICGWYKGRDEFCKGAPAGIDIWVEKWKRRSPYYESVRSTTSMLHSAFEKATQKDKQGFALQDDWTRYLEIHVHDYRLTNSALFKDALARLAQAAEEVRALIMSGDRQAPVSSRPYQAPARKAAM